MMFGLKLEDVIFASVLFSCWFIYWLIGRISELLNPSEQTEPANRIGKIFVSGVVCNARTHRNEIQIDMEANSPWAINTNGICGSDVRIEKVGRGLFRVFIRVSGLIDNRDLVQLFKDNNGGG